MDGRKEKENNVEIGKDISLNREWKWNKTVMKKFLIAISVSDYSQKPIDCTCWSLFVTYNFYIFDPPTLHEVRIPPSNSKTRHLRSPNYPTRLFFTLADFVSGFSLVNQWAPHVRLPHQQGGAYMAAAQVAGRWPGRRACDGGEPVARRRSSGDARAAQRGRRDAGKPTGRLTATG